MLTEPVEMENAMPKIPKYFGVIGNRDHIKIQGDKRPFWEFLDEQPDGWLVSLAYSRTEVPEDKPHIWDCGAWSYKMEKIPRLGKHWVTPAWAWNQYHKLASPGDMIVAPDHMFVSDEVIQERREWNYKSAEKFYRFSRGSDFSPMAVVHGTSIAEKVAYARELVDMGYKHLSLGGLAFRASSRKTEIISQVKAVCIALPEDVWVHVLGLSAPTFAKEWVKLGVDSFDGASHFKQAFSAGTFYMADEDRLISYQAASVTNKTRTYAPPCDCKACSMLRAEGIDTRTFGSNENNMGRAAHNLNQLMRVLKCVMSR